MFAWILRWFTGSVADSEPLHVEVEWEEDDPGPSVEVEDDPPWDPGACTLSLDQDEIVKCVGEALAAEREQARTKGERKFVERLEATLAEGEMDLPAFPDVARDLDALLTQDREPTMMQVVKLVEREPALVRRVWTRASSAEFRTPPKGLHFAISRIGFDELWRIAIQVCLQSSLFKVPGFQGSANRVRLYGVVTADVAAELSGERRGNAYMAGLLHDVGRLVVYRHADHELSRSQGSAGLVERIARDHHGALGVLVARSWRLGDEVTAALGFHHDPPRAPECFVPAVRWVRIANVAAHAVDAEQQGLGGNPMATIRRIAAGNLGIRDPLAMARRAFEAAVKKSH